MATRLQRLFIQRRGDQSFDLSRQCQFGGDTHIFMGGMACGSRDHAERQARRQQLEVEAIHCARFEARFARVGDDTQRKAHARDMPRLGQTHRIAHHEGTAIFIDHAMGQRLHHDLGPDAGGVAHGDGDTGFAHRASVPSQGARRKAPKPLF